MLSVLLATDFSVGSIYAIRYALTLFKNQPVAFTLVHAYPNHPEMMAEWPVPVENIQHNVERMLKDFLRKALSEVRDPLHTYRTLALAGDPAHVLLTLQSQEDFDHIIIGATGEGYSHSVGAVAKRVAESFPLTTLVVPTRMHLQPTY